MLKLCQIKGNFDLNMENALLNCFTDKIHVYPRQQSDVGPLAMVANGLPTLAQRWQTNQSLELVGKWLANGWTANVVLPT